MVREFIRGEKRVLTEVVIDQDGTDKIDFGAADPLSLSREEVKEKLLESGLWPVLRQRPVSHRCTSVRDSKGCFYFCL